MQQKPNFSNMAGPHPGTPASLHRGTLTRAGGQGIYAEVAASDTAPHDHPVSPRLYILGENIASSSNLTVGEIIQNSIVNQIYTNNKKEAQGGLA